MLEELHPDFMDISCSRSVQEQIDMIDQHMAEKVRALREEKKRLIEAEKNKNATIGYLFEAAYPIAIFVGDKVHTKYGEVGIVKSIVDGKITFVTKEKEELTHTICRMTYVEY